MSSDLKNTTDTPTSVSQEVAQSTSQPTSQSTSQPTSQPIVEPTSQPIVEDNKKHSEVPNQACQSQPTNLATNMTSDNKEKKVTITIECSVSDAATIMSRVSNVANQDTKVAYICPIPTVQRELTLTPTVQRDLNLVNYPTPPASPMTIYPTNPFAMPFTPLPDEYVPVYARPRFLPVQPIAPPVIQPIVLLQQTRQPRGTPYGVDPNMQYRFA